MNFKVRKIKPDKNPSIFKVGFQKITPFLEKKSTIIALVGIIGVLLLVWGMQFLFAQLFADGPYRPKLNLSPLERDVSQHTNVLFLGVAGSQELGGFLTDSIMIASFNPKNPSVSFLSLPRDLFMDSAVGSRKVNEIFAVAKKQAPDDPVAGLKVAEAAVADFLNIDIHYSVVVNFDIFQQVVDALGGIDIFVSQDIEDPFYPADNYAYQTFVIRKGLQTLDGATALKYARSRKTSSDYDRARRQQDILLAIRDKAQEQALFSDYDKLKEFYDIYKDNIVTDLGITELMALAKLALDVDYTNAVVAVLNDDITKQGGYLYTPAKEFYGGQFVLLPQDIKETQRFIDLVLIHPDVLLENAQISLFNGSGIEGRARERSGQLDRLGLHVLEIGNFETEIPLAKNRLRVLNPKKKQTIEFLKKVFNTTEVEMVDPATIAPGNLIDIQVLVGTS